jgi:hypothetical protein
VSDELAAVTAQLPDSGELDWRSEAQRRFQDRIDELTADLRRAASALDGAADELAAALSAVAASAGSSYGKG